MSDNELPVTVAVRRPDGSVEQVRVGTAVRSGDGFVIRLELNVGGGGAAPRTSVPSAAPRPAATSGGYSGPLPTNFPNYGRSRGAPIQGATQGDLDYYANGARRTLNDPGKSRFHDKERALLAAIEAELSRTGKTAGAPAPAKSYAPPPSDDDGPPPPSDSDMPPLDEE